MSLSCQCLYRVIHRNKEAFFSRAPWYFSLSVVEKDNIEQLDEMVSFPVESEGDLDNGAKVLREVSRKLVSAFE